MPSWYTNSSSVSVTARLRSALPRRRRARGTAPPHENTRHSAENLHEDRHQLLSDFVGEHPEDPTGRGRCNDALHQTDAQSPEREAG